ncbi:MAG: ATP-dependent zinc metalloprotease FtsH [Verrucomicrobiota bacterium]
MQDNEPSDKQQNDGNNNDSGFNWKGLVLLFIALGLFSLAIWSKTFSDRSSTITFSEFKDLVRSDRILVDPEAEPAKLLRLVQKDGSYKQYITGWYLVDDVEANDGKPEAEFKTPVILDYVGDELKELLAAEEIEIADLQTDSDGFGVMMMSFYLPIIFLLILLYFLFRHQIKAAGRGAMSFGKSKAKLMSMDKNKVTFKDVAGVEEAKEEVWEIVEYLRDPKKFQRLGGRIPKGVLMVGSPGTGKTLLARAIAGEADVPFFSISGSDFVEMFVGVGASRVRDMFEQGNKNAPCLIFIDEIDAVGRHRGHGLGGGHDEREQTLNALLVEMDGFDTQEGVIIIAATNRPDVLDPALLRPGRFDREITVALPDVKGREEILRVHSKKVKIAADVDMGVVARGTPGYSGAELANVINEAALLAARKGLKAISMEEMEEARDKVRWGKERRSLALSEDEKKLTAYHEAGHALLGMLVKDTDPVHKVTIIPRGPALGVTMYLPEEDKHSYKRGYLLDRLILIMGGRVAEELVFGDVTNGAAGDIRQASEIARKMVCNWGMSDQLGMVEYGEGQDQVFLARDISSPRNYSEATAQKIDDEVRRFTDEAYAEATRLIEEHRDKLEIIAQGLLEFETLDGSHIRDIMEYGEMKNPPAPPTPPELPEEEPQRPAPKKEKPDSDEGFSGDLAPAGA